MVDLQQGRHHHAQEWGISVINSGEKTVIATIPGRRWELGQGRRARMTADATSHLLAHGLILAPRGAVTAALATS